MTTDHPAREDAAPMFWQTDTGSMLVIRVPPFGFASDGGECSGITGIDFDVDSIPSRSGGQDAVTYM
jgi:hypothetical protein